MKTTYWLLSLIFISILSGLLYYNTVLVDTQAYVPSTYYLQGEILGDDDTERVLQSYAFKRPVEIMAAAMLEPFVGVRQAYSILNMIIFAATTILFYYWLKKFFKNHEQKEILAYIGAALYAVSLPLMLYATRVLVDAAGYLTLVLGLWVIEYVFEKKEIRWAHLCFVGLVLGLFFLVRDAVIILVPYYCIRYLIHINIIKEIKNTKSILTAFFMFLTLIIIIFVPEFIFMWYYNVGSVLSGKAAAITAGKYSLLGWLKFIIVHGAAFHIAYILAYVGWKQEQEKERRLFYALYGLCALLYLVGIQLVALTSPRFSMVLFPVLLPLAALGILFLAEKWKNTLAVHKTIICFILLYAIISFLGAWLYPSRTMILEDAGGNAVINAVLEEIKMKLGVF
ncbi:glycosyltransferase family 39 protein [Candidatus Woesearchaeota archaeon]|nr:glycosyltransferase family 39 protein [Candidatus Woesearchaeota archaeon]